MVVLMANCTGTAEDYQCGGRSSVWDKQGFLIGQLNDTDEGILIFDTETQQVVQKAIRQD